jgi:hypothetical protein
MRRIALLVVLALYALSGIAVANPGGCPDPNAPTCGITGGVHADQAGGDFHGLIMVADQPEVLERAAHAGTQAGCGDCVWTLVLMCLDNTPGDGHDQHPCVGVNGSQLCKPKQLAFRLYLTTDAVTNELVDTLCLGGTDDVVPVGDIAAADVADFLKDVTPPELDVQFQPPNGALTGLPTYVQASPPADLRPQLFGGGDPRVTETITIAPQHYVWQWGDGTDGLATDDPGGRYPTGHVTHTYTDAGTLHGTLTTQWGATYTITVAGETFGPYVATGGLVPRTQSFTLPVRSAHSRLVSGR